MAACCGARLSGAACPVALIAAGLAALLAPRGAQAQDAASAEWQAAYAAALAQTPAPAVSTPAQVAGAFPAFGPTTLVTTMPYHPSLNGQASPAVNEKTPSEPWMAVAAAECLPRFIAPPAPTHATDLNGVRLPDACFRGGASTHHVFVIGDWGGVVHPNWKHNTSMFPSTSGELETADKRSSPLFKQYHREWIIGADDVAQLNVAAEMAKRSALTPPDYVLNVGDNFYWGGVRVRCGAPPYSCQDQTAQFAVGFEKIYRGPGLDGKQWLGVLGNHDYGGWMFTNGWDQAIGYTWAKTGASTGRWMTPAQYWAVKVHYDTFSVDYYFVDNNFFDTADPQEDPAHNICSALHNPTHANCGPQGPASVGECNNWFKTLWEAEQRWLRKGLAGSSAEWQVIVTHFPPEGAWGVATWSELSRTYGIDLIISGHRHTQEVRYTGNPLYPTAYVISGGGGGITSENAPRADGLDDQYGFMDLALSSQEIRIEAISHRGATRSTTCVRRRNRMAAGPGPLAGPSLCSVGQSMPAPAAAAAVMAPQAAASAAALAPGGVAAPAVVAVAVPQQYI